MKWLKVGNEILVYSRDGERLGSFKKDDFPDMILAMCEVLKNG